MHLIRQFLLVTFGLLIASAAVGGGITTFQYDALGRLIAAETRIVGGNGSHVEYVFDHASNRTNVRSSGPFRPTWLNAGESLQRGQTILSDDARYKLVFQFDGDLALYDQTNTKIWSTGTTGSGSDRVSMQVDGNLVMYAGAQPIWYTNTGYPGSRFAVQNDSNIVVYSPNNGPVWARVGCC